MIVKHPNVIRWFKPVLDNPMDYFGKNNRARLRSTLNKIENFPVRHEIAEVSEEFLSWFIPMYENRINQKENPRVIDIADRTIHNPKFEYKYLALYDGDKPLGASIFRYRDNELSIAWRTYENTWGESSFQANPSLYTEYLISKIANDEGKETICHGRDNNPYGVFSNIGLAAFKLSGGSHPELTVKYDVIETETDDLEQDALIMTLPEVGEVINKAYLVTTEDDLPKHQQILKTPPELLNIEVVIKN